MGIFDHNGQAMNEIMKSSLQQHHDMLMKQAEDEKAEKEKHYLRMLTANQAAFHAQNLYGIYQQGLGNSGGLGLNAPGLGINQSTFYGQTGAATTSAPAVRSCSPSCHYKFGFWHDAECPRHNEKGVDKD